ncbi:MAG: extracellular solute-binding protein [Thermomicrobiales bacterium]
MNREETFRIAIRRFGPFESAIQKQWADFQRTTGCPLHLAWEALDLNPLVASLFTRDGLRDGTWDMAFIVTDWLADAVAAGALLDLAPLMAVNPVPDYPHGWAPALTGMQQFGAAIYGLPYHDGPECLIYRSDLFADPREQAAFADRFGYPLAPPRTWHQFVDIARFFHRPEQGLFGTVFAAFPDGHNTVYDFCLQLWSRGGELTDAAGRPTLATPAAHAALEFYRELVQDRTATPPGQEAIDSVKSGELFASGAVAMMVNWFGFAAVCEQPGSAVKGKTAVTTIPSAAGTSPASLIVYWLLSVAAGSPHPETAFAFARHCCSAAMDKLTTLEGGIGCRLSTWTDPDVTALIPFYADLPRLHAGTRTLPRSRSLPALIHIIDQAVQSAISGRESTRAILLRAQDQAEHLQV